MVLTKKTRWNGFLNLLSSKIEKVEDLCARYLEGKIKIKESQAQKTIQEAAEIAAKTEAIKAKTSILKQNRDKDFNKNVDDVFADDASPDIAKKLKLANLLANNPDMIEQLKKVNSLIEELGWKKGTQFEIVDSPTVALPEHEADDTTVEVPPNEDEHKI